MREVITTGRNIILLVHGDDRLPMVECVLTCTEPEHRSMSSGLGRGEKVTTIRFSASPGALRQMSEQFATWADEADDAAPDTPAKDA